MTAPISLIAIQSVVTQTQLEPIPGDLVVCDCYVAGAEGWESVHGGYARGRILNVDHHADTERMRRPISSANLALQYVDAVGAPPSGVTVVINHTDCDSILSSGIMSGRLVPDPIFGHAAVAADHTGAAHPVADLLQALDWERDVELSFRCLDDLLHDRPLPAIARAKLDERQRMRERAERVVREGVMHMDGPIAWGVFDETIFGEFFPALLPDAVAILAIAPHHDLLPGRLEMKLRLGTAAPSGFTLKGLLDDFDPMFGGRWNAGANKRPLAGMPGGSEIPPATYAAEVRRRVEARLAGAHGR